MRVPKTIKLFINGAFPRTESGRSFSFNGADGSLYANLCDATRKDLRASVDAARGAFEGWAARAAYNRGQILYRMAEMASSRSAEIEECLRNVYGMSESEAAKEAEAAADSFVYFAGFTDKYQQLIGSVNPVSGPHHNFTTAEPVGVVGMIPSEKTSYSEYVSQIAAVIASGNTAVALMPGKLAPMLAPLSEVLATSDLPAGVVNLLTESKREIFKHMAAHMEIQALSVGEKELFPEARKLGVENMKRVVAPRTEANQLATILDFVEFKTVWHPIGV
ncbi:MAG TPA: aldehyde dehydrogenase family protein [Bdellovibrionota bacterium]|jgi:acyl-CoA reductase-like NAD-dependent aldehyde dehydrogenase